MVSELWTYMEYIRENEVKFNEAIYKAKDTGQSQTSISLKLKHSLSHTSILP